MTLAHEIRFRVPLINEVRVLVIFILNEMTNASLNYYLGYFEQTMSYGFIVISIQAKNLRDYLKQSLHVRKYFKFGSLCFKVLVYFYQLEFMIIFCFRSRCLLWEVP